MSVRIAINGYGRIGRCIVRAIFEYGRGKELDIVAINDLSGIASTSYHTRFDSTHGRFQSEVSIDGNTLIIDAHPIQIIQEKDPEALPWKALDIDIVLECTGCFTSREKAMQHIKAGAKKVLISAPGQDADATIVYGVNHQTLKASDIIVSNASCTTNCLATVVKPLQKVFQIESGLLNTVHSYTKDQLLLDGSHDDFRRARSATHSIIPTKTGAASALGLVLPELTGRLDGFAMRVPTMNVSVIDFTFTSQRETSVALIHEVMRQASAAQKDILDICDEPLVSCDFNHHKASAIFDTSQTKVLGKLSKVIAWYDNEWGFSNRMLDTAAYMMTC